MQDHYSDPTQQYSNEGPKAGSERNNEEKASTEMPPKGPSRASVQRVLDYSKAYEAIQRADGSNEFIELIRN
jgi:hypothetical protein